MENINDKKLELWKVRELEDLIGLSCTYTYSGEDSNWTVKNKSLECVIRSYYVSIEDSYPYNLEVLIGIEPIGEHDLDEDELMDLSFGVHSDDLYFM